MPPKSTKRKGSKGGKTLKHYARKAAGTDVPAAGTQSTSVELSRGCSKAATAELSGGRRKPRPSADFSGTRGASTEISWRRNSKGNVGTSLQLQLENARSMVQEKEEASTPTNLSPPNARMLSNVDLGQVMRELAEKVEESYAVIEEKTVELQSSEARVRELQDRVKELEATTARLEEKKKQTELDVEEWRRRVRKAIWEDTAQYGIIGIPKCTTDLIENEDRCGGYTLTHVLGEGKFAKCVAGYSLDAGGRRNGIVVAIKQVNKLQTQRIKTVAALQREIAAIRRLHHVKGVIDLFDVLHGPKYFSIVMEMAGEDLFNYIDRHVSRAGVHKLEIRAVIIIFKECVVAMNAVHEEGIAHLDIKPENVCVQTWRSGKAIRVKICDFGLCEFVNDGQKINAFRGSPGFFAPEVVNAVAKEYDPFKADVWSLGCLLLNFVIGHTLFGSCWIQKMEGARNPRKYVEQVEDLVESVPDLVKHLDKDVAEILAQTLFFKPEGRLSLAELLNTEVLRRHSHPDQPPHENATVAESDNVTEDERRATASSVASFQTCIFDYNEAGYKDQEDAHRSGIVMPQQRSMAEALQQLHVDRFSAVSAVTVAADITNDHNIATANKISGPVMVRGASPHRSAKHLDGAERDVIERPSSAREESAPNDGGTESLASSHRSVGVLDGADGQGVEHPSFAREESAPKDAGAEPHYLGATEQEEEREEGNEERLSAVPSREGSSPSPPPPISDDVDEQAAKGVRGSEERVFTSYREGAVSPLPSSPETDSNDGGTRTIRESPQEDASEVRDSENEHQGEGGGAGELRCSQETASQASPNGKSVADDGRKASYQQHTEQSSLSEIEEAARFRTRPRSPVIARVPRSSRSPADQHRRVMSNAP